MSYTYFPLADFHDYDFHGVGFDLAIHSYIPFLAYDLSKSPVIAVYGIHSPRVWRGDHAKPEPG